MRLFIITFLLFFACGFALESRAQSDSLRSNPSSSTTRTKWLSVSKQNEQKVAFWTDSLAPIPSSIRLIGTIPTISDMFGKDIKFRFEFSEQKLYLQNSLLQVDSIQISYQTIPFKVGTWNFKRSQEAYELAAEFNFIDTVRRTSVVEDITTERQEIFSSNLQKTGSITRGISVGNQQDVFVNSNLNLQLEGNLTDDITLSAIISDQNVPFQPEGNTQQLQQFDRIQIQLRHPNATLSAGDVVLRQSYNPHFLRFYKNVLGGTLEGRYSRDSTILAEAKVGIAAAKGQFQSYQLPVQEGVQGAYRLVGANNERFIIVEAGSERIYLDGQLLQRGFNYDYIIDYNTAEITFNPHIVITQFSVVRVEFEYTNQFYNRTIQNIGTDITLNSRQKKSNLEVFVEHYNESDNENQPINFDVSEERRQLLSDVGDSLELAIIESAEEVEEFSVNQILYTQKDSLIDGQSYTIYLRATAQDERLFIVAFSEVGQGNGDYRLGDVLANGREYVFVGINQGDFAPLRQLPAPNSRSMTNVGVRWNQNPNTQYFVEGAFSERDINLFSDLDSEDDNGNAFIVGFQTKEQALLGQKKWKLSYGADYERDNQFFQPIDRFRSIQFDRDWTLPNFFNNLPRGEDHIAKANIAIAKDPQNAFSYEVAYRDRENTVSGTQHQLTLNKRLKNFQVTSNAFFLSGENNILFDPMSSAIARPIFLNTPQKVSWQRYSTDIKYRNAFIIPAYTYSVDKQTYSLRDSVTATLMNFEEHLFYLLEGDSSKKSQYRVSYSLRDDFLPQEGVLKPYTFSQTIRAEGSTDFENQKFTWNATYRKLDYQPDFLDSVRITENTENLMGRIDWRSNYFKRAIRQELTYNTATGREPAREFTFIRVDGTEGTHTWRDDNDDGIQQLNEFYEALNPDERNFIKVFTPTNEYINAFSTNFVYKLTLTPPRKWRKAKGLKKGLSLFSSVFSIQNTVKTTESEFAKRFLPFSARDEEETLSEQTALRSILFLNRTNPKWGGEFRYTLTRQKNLLANGFESKDLEEIQTIGRANISKTITLKTSLATGNRSNTSDFLENRNYDILLFRLQPELAWQPQPTFRVSTLYRLEQKSNQLGADEALVNEARGEVRYSKVGDRVWNIRFRYLEIGFEGEPNTPVGYELLEALRPGQNMTWELNLQQKLFNGLQLSVVYEGRKSEERTAVHIGRVQVTALF